jgi:hypothetical protein
VIHVFKVIDTKCFSKVNMVSSKDQMISFSANTLPDLHFI